MRKTGPYSRPSSLIEMDQRSKEARILAGVRADLAEHVGGRPSSTQRMLIDRAAWLTLHVAQLDAKAAGGPGLTELDHRTYLAWSNSLTRTLAALGLHAPAERVLSPAEALGFPPQPRAA